MKNSIVEITERIKEKSRPTRLAYLARVDAMLQRQRGADRLGCANVAHAIAALPKNDKLRIVSEKKPNIAIVTAYNDMLSAHKPYENYPSIQHSLIPPNSSVLRDSISLQRLAEQSMVI